MPPSPPCRPGSWRESPRSCLHSPPIHRDWEAGLNQPHTRQGPGIASLPSPGCQGARPCTRPADRLSPRCLHMGLKCPLPSPSHSPGASSPPPHCTLTKHFKCTNAAIPVRLWQGRHYHLRFSAERPRGTRQVTCQQPEPGRGVGWDLNPGCCSRVCVTSHPRPLQDLSLSALVPQGQPSAPRHTPMPITWGMLVAPESRHPGQSVL